MSTCAPYLSLQYSCVRVYLDGDGSGKGRISYFLTIMNTHFHKIITTDLSKSHNPDG